MDVDVLWSRTALCRGSRLERLLLLLDDATPDATTSCRFGHGKDHSVALLHLYYRSTFSTVGVLVLLLRYLLGVNVVVQLKSKFPK